ncbi:MAG: FAD:protein FMN transferase [Verrucomicrobiales bacterium]
MIARSFFLLCLMAMVAPAEEFRFERPMMGTRFLIVCHGADAGAAKKAAEAAFAIGGQLEAIASDYEAESELSRLGSAKTGSPVPLSPELFALLAHSRKLAEATDGAFDPTLGSLTRLWRETRKSERLPSAEILRAARESCGWQNFSLDPTARTITFSRSGMAMDLGGVAKGYAADLMVESLTTAGFPQTMVAAGGDIRLGDPPPGREGWRVAVQSFDRTTAEHVLVLANAAVSTSGDLHQSVEIDGITYSHIVDPNTGLGLTRRIAATVVANEAKLSDPLATAACVLGHEKGEGLRQLPGVREVKVRILQDDVPPARSEPARNP